MYIVPAHAKLNLALAITGRRHDGWHELDSVIVPLDWHDLVGVSLMSDPMIRLRVTGRDAADLGDPEVNLVVRAARAALPAGVGAEIWLHKRIPTMAGLGGGSADAAAVLAVLRGRFPDLNVVAIAPRLGSDVPALLAARPVRVTGVGEICRPIAAPALNVVVAIAGRSSTVAAYAAVEAAEIGASSCTDHLMATLGAGLWDDTGGGSALEAPACRSNPALDTALTRLRSGNAHIWHMTGSGGAVFAVTARRSDAVDLAAAVRAMGFEARACRTRGG